MLTFLIFFLSECSCTERFGTAWDITHYATAILLYQQRFSSIFLWEKGNVVVSWWYQLQCWGLIASWVLLRQITAPQVIPSLFPPTTALACWSGYSQHAQKGSAWVYFSQCLFPTSPPAWQNTNLCLSCSHSPHEPLALQGFIKVYGISCCLMPSTAAYFPKRNTLWAASGLFCPGCNQSLKGSVDWESLFCSWGHLHSSYILVVFFPGLASSVESVADNHKL